MISMKPKVVEVRTGKRCNVFRRIVIRSERLIELPDSWFSTKAILVVLFRNL